MDESGEDYPCSAERFTTTQLPQAVQNSIGRVALGTVEARIPTDVARMQRSGIWEVRSLEDPGFHFIASGLRGLFCFYVLLNGLSCPVGAGTVPATPAPDIISTDTYWQADRSGAVTRGPYLSPEQACASYEYISIILQATPQVGAIYYYGVQITPYPYFQCLFAGGIFDGSPDSPAPAVVGYALRDTRCRSGYSKIANDLCRRTTAPNLCPVGTWTLDAGGVTCSRPDGTDPDQNPQSCPATPLPVGIGTGGKQFTETDVSASSVSRLEWIRRYNSQIIRSKAVMSPQWTHSYSRWIETLGTTSAYLFHPDGRMVSAQLVDATITAGRQHWTVQNIDNEHLYRTFDAANNPIGWFVIDPGEQSVEYFDVNGLLVGLALSSGDTQSLSYSDGTIGPNLGYVLDVQGNSTSTPLPVGLLLRITDSFGRTLSLGYDAQSRIVNLTDPQGQTYRYTYNAAGHLASVTYPDGRSRQYLYNETNLTGGANLPHVITGLIDETGIRLGSYSYDSNGRAINSHWWADANQTQAVGAASLVFNTGDTTTVTDALSTQRTYSFTTINGRVLMTGQSQPGGSGCGPSSSAITYDANANVSSRIDFNNTKTCYAYDLNRNLETRRVEGLSGSANCSATLSSPPAGDAVRTITTEWHPDWRLETRRAEPRKITTSVYNGYGASCAPASALVDGKPIAVVCSRTEQTTSDNGGASGFGAVLTGTPRTWTYTYNPFGQMLTSDGPRTDITDTTAYEYYPNTQADWTMGDLKQITNAAGHVTRFTKYNRHGQVLERIDANGLVTAFTYDPRQRLTSVTDGSEQTLYAYDPVGNLIKVTLPDGASVDYTYDAAHRLTAIGDHKGNRIVYTLDAMGNRIGEQAADAGGQLVRNVSRVIDALNRVRQITGAP